MIPENLQRLRKYYNLAQSEFALKLSMSTRAYMNYERGERKPPYEMLIKLVNEFNVNLNWLIADKGSMFNQSKYEDIKIEILSEVEKMLNEKISGVIK